LKAVDGIRVSSAETMGSFNTGLWLRPRTSSNKIKHGHETKKSYNWKKWQAAVPYWAEGILRARRLLPLQRHHGFFVVRGFVHALAVRLGPGAYTRPLLSST
jgi:hypothetical protein